MSKIKKQSGQVKMFTQLLSVSLERPVNVDKAYYRVTSSYNNCAAYLGSDGTQIHFVLPVDPMLFAKPSDPIELVHWEIIEVDEI